MMNTLFFIYVYIFFFTKYERTLVTKIWVNVIKISLKANNDDRQPPCVMIQYSFSIIVMKCLLYIRTVLEQELENCGSRVESDFDPCNTIGT